MPYVIEGRKRLLEIILGTGTLYLGLVTDPATITESTEYDDLTFATFAGYGAISTTWNSVIVNGDDYGEVTTSAPFVFECSADGTAEEITAVVLYQWNGVTNKLVDYVNLVPNVVIEFDGDKITVTEWKLLQGSPVPIP